MNYGGNGDLCSVSSDLLWLLSDLMSTFDPTHVGALGDPQTHITPPMNFAVHKWIR